MKETKKIFSILALLFATSCMESDPLFIASKTVDLGYLKNNAQYTEKIKIKNVSEGYFYIYNLRASCGCVGVSGPDRLQANEESIISATFSTDKLGEFRHRILFNYGEDRKEKEIVLKGFSEQWYSLSPQNLSIKIDDIDHYPLDSTILFKPAGVHPSLPKIKKYSTSLKNSAVELIGETKDNVEQYQIKYLLPPLAEYGAGKIVNDFITIEFDDPKERYLPLAIPITIEVKSAVVLHPSSLFLGYTEPNQPKKGEVAYVINKRAGKIKNVEVIAIDKDDWSWKISEADPSKLTIEITYLTSNAKGGLRNCSLKLDFENNATVYVPVTVMVKA